MIESWQPRITWCGALGMRHQAAQQSRQQGQAAAAHRALKALLQRPAAVAKPEVVVEFMVRVVVKPEMLDSSGTDGIASREAGAVLIGHGEGDQEA